MAKTNEKYTIAKSKIRINHVGKYLLPSSFNIQFSSNVFMNYKLKSLKLTNFVFLIPLLLIIYKFRAKLTRTRHYSLNKQEVHKKMKAFIDKKSIATTRFKIFTALCSIQLPQSRHASNHFQVYSPVFLWQKKHLPN